MTEAQWLEWLDTLPQVKREVVEERAGIFEFEANLSREDAQRITWQLEMDMAKQFRRHG